MDIKLTPEEIMEAYMEQNHMFQCCDAETFLSEWHENLVDEYVCNGHTELIPGLTQLLPDIPEVCKELVAYYESHEDVNVAEWDRWTETIRMNVPRMVADNICGQMLVLLKNNRMFRAIARTYAAHNLIDRKLSSDESFQDAWMDVLHKLFANGNYDKIIRLAAYTLWPYQQTTLVHPEKYQQLIHLCEDIDIVLYKNEWHIRAKAVSGRTLMRITIHNTPDPSEMAAQSGIPVSTFHIDYYSKNCWKRTDPDSSPGSMQTQKDDDRQLSTIKTAMEIAMNYIDLG